VVAPDLGALRLEIRIPLSPFYHCSCWVLSLETYNFEIDEHSEKQKEEKKKQKTNVGGK
jgi:hypothetical protein